MLIFLFGVLVVICLVMAVNILIHTHIIKPLIKPRDIYIHLEITAGGEYNFIAKNYSGDDVITNREGDILMLGPTQGKITHEIVNRVQLFFEALRPEDQIVMLIDEKGQPTKFMN